MFIKLTTYSPPYTHVVTSVWLNADLITNLQPADNPANGSVVTMMGHTRPFYARDTVEQVMELMRRAGLTFVMENDYCQLPR